MSTPDIEAIQAVFGDAPFIVDLGIEVTKIQSGSVESRIEVRDRHLQQNGFVHAAVLAALADHTAGACAAATAENASSVLTVEYKINLLRPATGPALLCRAEALRVGKRLTVVDSRVFQADGKSDRLVAVAIVTLAIR